MIEHTSTASLMLARVGEVHPRYATLNEDERGGVSGTYFLLDAGGAFQGWGDPLTTPKR